MTPLPVQLLPWSPGASRAVALLQQASMAVGDGNLGSGLAIFARDTPPDSCILVRALRDPTIWGARVAQIGDKQQGYQKMAVTIQTLNELCEKRAREEGARAVGERHVAAELIDAGAVHFGVNKGELLAAVAAAELGPELPTSEISGRHHVLVDTSIFIQYQDLEQIDWVRELRQKPVVVWVPATVLNELDLLRGTSPSRRVRDRAAHFAKWVRPRMENALTPSGAELRPDVALRIWAPASPGGLRDTDHLEAVLELRERGVPVELVTRDTGMEARALAQRIALARIPDSYALEDERTEAERESAARLASEGILAPPSMTLNLDSLAVSPEGTRWLLSMDCHPDGGQARTTVVRWRAHGGRNLILVDRLTDRGTILPRPDGFVHQHIGFLVSPGSIELIAEIRSVQPVGSVEFVIRADGAPERHGELVYNGQTYEEREPLVGGPLGPVSG